MIRESLLLLLMWYLLFPPGGCVPGVPGGPGREQADFALPALHAVPDPVDGGRVVDAAGREVLLRGVNVNALVEYWAHDPALFTTYPLTPGDADLIAGMGWNVVRLLISWSRVEPAPGVYDEAYLDEVEAAVRLFQSRGIYSIIDLHQDAWGPSLAARADEPCEPFEPRAFGWDGAPEWATLHGGERRCIGPLGDREFSWAVLEAFRAFWADEPGPGGVGVRTRYVRMIGHLAARFSPLDAVAGFDVMNEPNVFQLTTQLPDLADLYGDALAAIRAAEAATGAPARLVFFEPSIMWAGFGLGVPPDFLHDDQIVYAPHLYQGGLDGQPLSELFFQQARDEAAVFGGAPVLSGEWGSSPSRAADPNDDYFRTHQDLQDRFRFGATLWTWREACGDPHKAGDARAGRIPRVWGLFDVDCATNQVNGMREPLVQALRRPYLRAAPGPIGASVWDPDVGVLSASGPGAGGATSLIAFAPSSNGEPPQLTSSGLQLVRPVPSYGGHFLVVAHSRGGPWTLQVEPR